MSKIESINLHGLRNNEHLQFMTDFDALIINKVASELGIESLYPAFNNAWMAEDAAIRVEQGSIKSKTIDQLDKLRGKTWGAIALNVKATLSSPFEDEAESAKVIQRIFDQYGNMRKLSFNEESAANSNLVKDLQAPANVVHLEKTGITAWVSELKNQNEQFGVVFNERNTELADRENGDVRAVRVQIDPLYAQIVEKINAAIILEVAKPVAITFASELNEKIKYFQTALASRSGRGKKDEKPAENV